MTEDFRPILYLKAGCPHCFKAQLFLTEARLIDRFDIREFVPGDDREAAIRAELAPHFAKPSYPTVQVSPGVYINESDDIIARYAAESGLDPDALPLTRTYRHTLLPRLRRLRAENKDLQARLDAASAPITESQA